MGQALGCVDWRSEWTTRHPFGLACLGMLLLATGCASARVHGEVLAADFDFGAVESFHLVSARVAGSDDGAVLEASIERVLVERGLASVGAADADVHVVYRASTQARSKRRNAGDPDANSYRIVDYIEGTLVIEWAERPAMRRVWRGQAVLEGDSTEALRASIDRTVAAIFAQLPER